MSRMQGVGSSSTAGLITLGAYPEDGMGDKAKSLAPTPPTALLFLRYPAARIFDRHAPDSFAFKATWDASNRPTPRGLGSIWALV